MSHDIHQHDEPDLQRRLKGRISSLFTRATAEALRAPSPEAVRRLSDAEQRFARGQQLLLVVGERDRGKSTLLNALLEEPELFPTGSSAVTRAVITAQWGPLETITVSLAATAELPAEERKVSREQLPVYISQAAATDGEAHPDAGRTVSVSIMLPNPKLGDGLVVVDTPGVGSVHAAHAAATAAVLPQADAVLYVTDATQPLLASELAFIEVVATAVDASAYPERLFFAVAKSDSDRAADPAETVRELRDRLAALPGVDAERLPVVPVSAHHRLRHLAAGDRELLELSNFEAFEAQLWPTVARSRARLRTSGALTELDRVAQALLHPVESALAVLDAGDEAARRTLVASAEAVGREAAALADGAAAWPQDLSRDLALGLAESCRLADDSVAEIWRRLRADYRDQSELIDDPQLILDLLARRLAVLVSELSSMAQEAAAGARDRVAAASGLPLPTPVLAGLPALPLPEPLAPLGVLGPRDAAAVRGDLSRAVDAAVAGAVRGRDMGAQLGDAVWVVGARKALSGGTDSVVKGAARVVLSGEGRDSPGALVGGALGALVGAVHSAAQELRALKVQGRNDRLAALDRYFAPWEAQQKEFLRGALTAVVAACEDRAVEELRLRLEDRRAECAAALQAAEEAQASVGRDTDAERAEAEQRRARLQELREDVRRIAVESLG